LKKLNRALAARMAVRGTVSYVLRRPIAVSFELTHSCTCNCRHCDHGGSLKGEKQLGPEDYRRLEKELRPVLLQLSGGEPTLRDDLLDIVRAVKEGSGLPYLIVVTNGSNLTEDLYLRSVEAGVNQFSVSLDFPDERHDDFRRHRGLFRHLSEIVPRLTSHGHGNVIMNTAITRWNLPVLEQCYERAREWGASISFSAYTAKRTKDPEFDIKEPGDLVRLNRTIRRLLELKRTNGAIVNSDWTLTGTYDFFRNGSAPGCKAGRRYLVINPDGTMRPCSMFDLRFTSRREMNRRFVRNNTCGECYVSIRAYLSESYWTLLSHNVRERVLKSRRSGCSE
jgi:MoaA/NifB/PqqE/SkfB family radical SAM enzyme